MDLASQLIARTDPAAVALVLGGTILATILRFGMEGLRDALSCLRSIRFSERAWKVVRAKLASQIQVLERDGLLRANVQSVGDRELDELLIVLVHKRSFDAARKRYDTLRKRRLARASQFRDMFTYAAEMAPVFGLVGTLLAMARLDAAPSNGVMPEILASAVSTTLCGLIAASLFFTPLGAFAYRRAENEDAARTKAAAWVIDSLSRASPPTLQAIRQVA